MKIDGVRVCRHRDKRKSAVSVHPGYVAESASHPLAEPDPITTVLWFCPGCKCVRDQTLRGHWSLTEVRGIIDPVRYSPEHWGPVVGEGDISITRGSDVVNDHDEESDAWPDAVRFLSGTGEGGSAGSGNAVQPSSPEPPELSEPAPVPGMQEPEPQPEVVLLDTDAGHPYIQNWTLPAPRGKHHA